MKRFKSAIWTSILVVVWSLAPSFVAAQDSSQDDATPAPPQESAALSAEQNIPQPAQPVQPSDDDSTRRDPPGRVARLQYLTGSVSIQPHGTDEWVQGSLNRPLTTSDNIWADKNSRVELSLGSSVMRLGAESSLTLTNVSDEAVQLQLHQGTLNLHVRRLFGGEIYEIDTPNQAFTVLKAGDYRFDVGPSGNATYVTVRRGEGEATGQGPSVRIKSGRQVRFTAGNSLQHDVLAAPGRDSFDDWCRVRDRRQDHSLSARYVGPGTVGYEDLDEYGYWREDSVYGPIWTPRYVAAGWSPYHYGHWVWISPWGWTWVDDAPWGFAPFHYGRWAYTGGYWGWVPGPYYARPYYAPALVVWFGGPRWGFRGFGGGVGFGWCALGWREPFYPWYGGSRRYFRNVNITNTRIVNITNVTNIYYNNRGPLVRKYWTNMGHPGGFTAVSKATIVNGQPVARNATHVPTNMRSNAPPLRQVEVAPNRGGRLGIHADQRVAGAPQGVVSRPTVTRMTPPADVAGRGRTHVTVSEPGNSNPRIARVDNSGTALGGRFVPRPPSVMANGQIGRGPEHAAGPRSTPDAGNSNPRIARVNGPVNPGSANAPGGRYVPRPPSSLGNGSGAPRGGDATRRGEPTGGESMRGGPQPRDNRRDANPVVVRPPSGSTPRPAENSTPSAGPNRGGYNRGGDASNRAPRPTGPVAPAPRDNGTSAYPRESPRTGGGYRGDGGYRSGPRVQDIAPRNYAPRNYGGAPQGGSYRQGGESRVYAGPSGGGRVQSSPGGGQRSGSYGGGGWQRGSVGSDGGGHHRR
jgi:hypothetical protein